MLYGIWVTGERGCMTSHQEEPGDAAALSPPPNAGHIPTHLGKPGGVCGVPLDPGPLSD